MPRPSRATAHHFVENALTLTVAPSRASGFVLRREAATRGAREWLVKHRQRITRAIVLAAGSQYAAGAQSGHFHLAYAEPAKDLGIVLSELRGDGAHPHPLADLDRGADVRDLAQFRVAGILHEGAVTHLRVGEHLRVIVNWAARHTGRLEHLDPMVSGLHGQHRVHRVFERRAVRHALLIGRKMRVLAPFRVPQSLSTARPDRLAGGTHHQIAVLGPHPLVGRVLAMARALPGRLLMVGEPLRRGPRAEADL